MCFFFAGSPISGALLTGRYLWWAPAVFCGVCLSQIRRKAEFGGLAYSLVQATALAGSVLFVGVHFSLAHAGSGAVRRCTGGESERVVETKTGSSHEKKEIAVET